MEYQHLLTILFQVKIGHKQRETQYNLKRFARLISVGSVYLKCLISDLLDLRCLISEFRFGSPTPTPRLGTFHSESLRNQDYMSVNKIDKDQSRKLIEEGRMSNVGTQQLETDAKTLKF